MLDEVVFLRDLLGGVDPAYRMVGVSRGVTTLKKVVRNASQGRLVGGGAALFKRAPMPKCTILKMQHSTGDT